jgi:putative DNA primase/helicase
MSADLRDRLEQQGIVLRRYKPGDYRIACPHCSRSPRDDRLGVEVFNDGSARWHCFGCDWRGGIPPERWGIPARLLGGSRPARQERPERKQRTSLAAKGLEIWKACKPIEPGTVAATYLETRRCSLPHEDGDLRWHPSLKHWPSGYVGPVLVGLATNTITAEPVTLHFTWLAADGSGKAPIDRPRLYLPGHSSKGVIRLWPDEEVTLGLTIGEGIETCLTAAAAGLRPVWAAMDAGNLGAFPVLPGLEGLTILVDHDPPNRKTGVRAGHAAAIDLIERYVGAGFDRLRDIRVVLPPVEGQDVNDLEVAS